MFTDEQKAHFETFGFVATSVPHPPPADVLRQQGLPRTAEIIARLTALNLHSPTA